MNINFNNIATLVGGRMVDPRTNLIFPWYTKGMLEKLCTWDIKSWRVFEYGCGDSTFWWKENTSEVISIDTNHDWSIKCNSFYTENKNEFINFPLKFTKNEKFDCIIIDSEPVEWRDECTLCAIESLKENGILIIDNYKQKSVNLEYWPITDNLLIDKKNEIFPQDGHKDWKTGYWII